MSAAFDKFVKGLNEDTVRSVRSAARRVFQAREFTLAHVFTDVDAARKCASQIKQAVLDDLKNHLLQLEENCTNNGITVHWATDASSATKTILEICDRVAPTGALVVKAKSMATEEIHLNASLIKAGHTPVETDLGEFVVQLDDDTPSHIVAPIIHKDRRDVAKSFERNELGPYTEVPEELAMQARAHLRKKFCGAHVGVSGVNFAIAETGRLVIVENEGNNRLSTTAPPVHIAVMGIEKILPREEHLPLFLRLLAGSATGQRLTVYTHFITGPRKDECDGPKEVHLILLDNGRTKALQGPHRDILKCIRCGACLNVCPVYRRASGHAYANVYSGPLGAVLTPAVTGAHKDLAKASSLCGACQSVCPVDIPLPDLLLKTRALDSENASLAWKGFGFAARSPHLWKAAIKMLPMAQPPKAWTEYRARPEKKLDFRRWWNDRP